MPKEKRCGPYHPGNFASKSLVFNECDRFDSSIMNAVRSSMKDPLMREMWYDEEDNIGHPGHPSNHGDN